MRSMRYSGGIRLSSPPIVTRMPFRCSISLSAARLLLRM
jgi:hypothetical protein